MDDCYKNLLFSMDLINYVMKMMEQNIELGGDLKSRLGDSPFQDVIGKAVLNSPSDKGVLYLEAKELSLKEISLWTMNQFTEFVDVDSGFNPNQFISYCGMVCTLMESYFLKSGNRDVCEVLANAICNRLDGLTLYGYFKEENWGNLAKAADKIAKQKSSKKARDPSTPLKR